MPFYQQVGDLAHIANVINIALYGSIIYHYGFDVNVEVFDKEWLHEGFCLPHEDIPYRNTHDLSGYVMVFFTFVGLIIQQSLSRSEKMGNAQSLLATADKLTFWALIGALGHASGHFIISNAKRKNLYPPADERFLDDLRRSTIMEGIMKAGPGYPLFWIPLVKTYMMNTAKGRVALLALLINAGAILTPVKFGFAYTQAVLFGGMSFDQLTLPRKEKGFEYALWPWLTVVPNGMFAWVECLTCGSSFLMRNHGHVVYDLYMVCSYIIFYLICWAGVRLSKPKLA